MSNRNWSELCFDFTFKMTDGSQPEVRSTIAQVLAWERNHKGASWISAGRSLTDMIWLGWAALKKQGQTEDDFQLFASRVEDFAADPVKWDEGGDVLPDPTPTDQSVG